MNRLPLAVGAVAVLVVAIGGALLVSQRNQTGVGAPTSAPSSPPPTSAASATDPAARVQLPPIPAALQYTWMGPSRPIPELGTTTRMQVRFDLGFSWITGTQLGFASHLSSTVDPGTNTMRLTLRDAEAGCQVGDVGEYRWSLSPTGLTLTLTPTSDPCIARSAAMSGTWLRVNCTNTDDGCFGDLDAGTHPSQYVDPRRAVGGRWEPAWGALTYTVPAGWANSQDWPNQLVLTPSADYSRETYDGPPGGIYHDLGVVTHPSANKATPDCGRSIDTTVPGTVDGLLHWLANEPAFDTTAPVAITVDGHPGKWVDLRLDPKWRTTCPGGQGKPERNWLAYPTESDNDAWSAGIAGQERYRVILFDLDGQTIAILIDSGDPARFDDLVSQSLPIIQSFKFQ